MCRYEWFKMGHWNNFDKIVLVILPMPYIPGNKILPKIVNPTYNIPFIK